ncbi:MAG: M56 family metallopeptidase [Dyadobacter sp.]|uniref:M56 family metallopeptidase n=1 Tax=Dyadobacter sp. TaxID=1914288 RepID=UPI00326757AB
MSPFIEYIVKLSLGLTVISIFYQFVLARYTFYNWNRWYLLGYSALAFAIPFIDVDQVLEQTKIANSSVVLAVPSIATIAYSATTHVPAAMQRSDFNWLTLLPFILLIGSLVLLARLGIHFASYLKMVRESELISDEDIRIYHSAKDIVPFSFGNAIFINPTLHTDDDLKEIVLHEFVHVKQKHTFDILFSEILCILNWYNPFAWLIRHAIRQNLEYIADRAVLENGIDVKRYQYLLLKVVGVPEFRIANQFNFSSLKQRIVMMNKMRTARIHLIRFLFVLPLLCVLLMACRNNIETLVDGKKAQDKNFVYVAGLLSDAITGRPVENLPLKLDIGSKFKTTIYSDAEGFFHYRIDLDAYKDSVVYYGIEGSGEYKTFGMGSVLQRDAVNESRFFIFFLNPKKENEVGQFPYFADGDDFFTNGKATDVGSIKTYLIKRTADFKVENDLKRAFKQAYPKPKEMLTKFGNGYFDLGGTLVGYESQTELYLDGKKVSHQEINKAFDSQLIKESYSVRSDSKQFDAINSKMTYYTFPTHKTAPPAYLIKNNYEVVDVNEFDTTAFDKDAYFLDGFRQTYGIGSNLKPLKSEIKRVFLFKGNLARYYDQKRDKIWWIETRPKGEVYQRPALASY